LYSGPKLSNGSVSIEKVRTDDIDTIKFTKNQENGTINTHTINFGNACLSSQLVF